MSKKKQFRNHKIVLIVNLKVFITLNMCCEHTRSSQVQQRARHHAERGRTSFRHSEDAMAVPARTAPLPVDQDKHRHRDVSEWLGSGITTLFFFTDYRRQKHSVHEL